MPTTTTVNSDLVIYSRLAQTAYMERIQDVLDVFNTASAGTMVMRSEGIEGDFSRDAFYLLDAPVAHRNVNSVAAAPAVKLTADEMVGVKSPWKFGPVRTTEEAFKRRARSVDEFWQKVGEEMADQTLDYMIDCAFAALSAAIGANTDMTTDGVWGVDGHKVLTKGLRLMGDRSGRVATWAMDSATYFDLVDNAIGTKLFEEAGLVVYGGTPGTFGKPALVTDKCPEATIFGLQPGAVEVIESQPPGTRAYEIDGLENLAIGFQAEGVFNLELMGYSWATEASPTPAPANPNKTQIGTGANWRKYASSNKATAGFIINILESPGA
jgi:hypothetical protein